MAPDTAALDAETRRWLGARMAACVTAKTGGWFWLPCPVCGEHFGGQEWRDIDGLPSSVPDPYSPRSSKRYLSDLHPLWLRLSVRCLLRDLGLRRCPLTRRGSAAPTPPFALWQEARAYSADADEQNRRWRWLMIANGYMVSDVWQEALGHRILAAHGPGETCDDCPCWHCGSSADADGDHSCPCPHHDNDCPWHVNPMGAKHG